MLQRITKPVNKQVTVLVLAEWFEHPDGVLHIDRIIQWVKESADEIRASKSYRFSRSPTRVRKVNLQVTSVIPPRVMNAVSGSHIVVADLGSFRKGQKYNVNVAYEIGAAAAIRAERTRLVKKSKRLVDTPLPFVIAATEKFAQTKVDFSDFSGITLGQYDLKQGLTEHTKRSLKNLVQRYLRVMNLKYYK